MADSHSPSEQGAAPFSIDMAALDEARQELMRDPSLARHAFAELAALPARDIALDLAQGMTEACLDDTATGLNLSEADLSGLDLSRFDLRGADLSRARLASTDLSGALLRQATMICPLMERTSLRGADLRNFYAHAISIVSADASGADLRGAIDCTGALFHGVKFVNADLSGGNFAGASFYQCDLTGANLARAVLSGAVFNECLLYDTDFTGAFVENAVVTRSQAKNLVLDNATGEGFVLQSMTQLNGIRARAATLCDLRIRRTSVEGADFTAATLHGATFELSAFTDLICRDADLTATRFRSVFAPQACFDAADLTDACITDSMMASSSYVGTRAENARLTRCSMPESSFSDGESASVFSGRGFAARDCDLRGADFSGAYLYRAFFTGDPVTGMCLDGASFAGANLIQAYIAASVRDADLRGLQGAYVRLNQADLSGSDLRGANLYEASLVKTVLHAARLRGVAAPVFIDRCPGLETAELDDDLAEWTSRYASSLRTNRRGST